MPVWSFAWLCFGRGFAAAFRCFRSARGYLHYTLIIVYRGAFADGFHPRRSVQVQNRYRYGQVQSR